MNVLLLLNWFSYKSYVIVYYILFNITKLIITITHVPKIMETMVYIKVSYNFIILSSKKACKSNLKKETEESNRSAYIFKTNGDV